ncbi:MAG TPA: hypothetical protein VJO32_18375 [Ktedonobacteraceae bacterium]|nr:hypothetical protein [Ktedonobacteraceae bacterium]
MKPFDDSIPEEIDTQHAALVSMLRQALPRPVQLTSAEQAQIIERASQRLLANDQAVSGDEDEAAHPVGVANSIPVKKSASYPFAARRGRRIVQFASMLAAILVVAAIVSASLLLFQHRQAQTIGSTPPFHPPANMTTVSSTAGGFEMTLSLTPGPYFLSELLAAGISLTNHTGKTMYVGIPFVGSGCGYATGVLMVSGGGPNYSIPIPTDHSCPGFVNSTSIKPGQTLTVQKYLPLTNSGHVILTAETQFYTSARQQVSNPLDGHWPSLQIDVASKVPADRIISYHRDGTRVFINAPTDAQHLLQYLYGVSCQDLNDQGSTGSGNYGWQTLQKNVVGEPGCPGKNVQWTFAFGLPGYAIVQGSVTFPGNSPNP